MHHRPRVLIVDDDPSIRTWLRLALAASDEFTVIGEAADGADALERAVALQPDAVVTDLRMPVIDGYTTVVMLQRRMPHVRIVVHSAEEDISTLRDVRKLGVPLVTKTGDAEPILVALRTATSPAFSA